MTNPNGQDATAVFEILIREHADMLEAYVRSIQPTGATVDDIFQETMLVAWRRLPDFDRTRSFGAWLRGIAHVLVMEHARKGRTRPICTDPAVLSELELRFDRYTRAAGDTFRDGADRLTACLERLPAAMREALELVYARGMAVNRAAASIGANEETFKKRVQRARHTLAACLDSVESAS